MFVNIVASFVLCCVAFESNECYIRMRQGKTIVVVEKQQQQQQQQQEQADTLTSLYSCVEKKRKQKRK